MTLPGRLGDPQMSLATDPRTNLRLLTGLKVHHMQNNISLRTTITTEAEAIGFAHKSEQSLESLVSNLNFSTPHPWSSIPITQSSLLIPGIDGNQIKLVVYRPANNEPLPAILYFHGGIMTILKTFNNLHTSWASTLAQLGCISVLVDFRNVLSSAGPLNHFPAGLNDCISTVHYIHSQRSSLGIEKIILHGDSGGGNLALATALRLNEKEETRDLVDGVCVIDPCISGAYGLSREWKLEHLPSLIECDGYDVSCEGSAILAGLYERSESDVISASISRRSANALAWPYWTSPSSMTGLPPHFILTAELDPLRDEGNEYLRKLIEAGVSAEERVRKGMTHCGELLFREYVVGEFAALIGDMRGWAFGEDTWERE